MTTPRSNIVKLRLTDLEKKDWQEAAGGARKLSEWVRSVCNSATQSPVSEVVEHLHVKPQVIEDAIVRETTPKQCNRWMHHRPGVYCGACKRVIGK